jgi:hypothetical protein
MTAGTHASINGTARLAGGLYLSLVDHLVFANIVDPFLRKGYRFKGVAVVLESGALYDRPIAFYREPRFPGERYSRSCHGSSSQRAADRFAGI